MSSHPEQLPHLRAGWHLGPDDGTCLMEHVSQVAGLTKAIISFWTELPLCGIIRTWQGGVAVHSRKNGFMRSD
jgi:hypothetical protein